MGITTATAAGRAAVAEIKDQAQNLAVDAVAWRAELRRFIEAYGAAEPPNFHGGTRWAPPVTDGTPEAVAAREIDRQNSQDRVQAYHERRPFFMRDVPRIRGQWARRPIEAHEGRARRPTGVHVA